MALIDINRSYDQGSVLVEADLDEIQSALTTFFNTTLVNDDVLLDNSIDGSTKLVDNTITTAKLADSSIGGVKVNTSAVTADKLATTAVTTAKLGDLAITTATINTSAVTTAKIADGSVTLAKKKVPAVTLSSSCGTYSQSTSSASGGPTSITNLSAAITTTQGRVAIFLQPDGDNQGYIENSVTYNTSSPGSINAPKDLQLKLYRDATLIYTWTHYLRYGYLDASQKFGIQLPLGYFSYIDTPSDGTYTYTLKADYAYNIAVSGNITESVIKVVNAKLAVVEL